MAAEAYPESARTAAMSSAPSGEFTSTHDPTKWTKAIYIVADSNQAVTIHCHPTDTDETWRLGGEYHPLATKTEITVSGYDVFYLY